MKKINIIMPFYNDADNITKMLNSLKPLRSVVELIVVDDKSKIDQFLKLKSIASQYDFVRIIQNTTEKKGAGVCRNIGLEYVDSEWLMFADSDDHFLDNAFSTISKYLNSDFDMIYFVPTSTDEHGNVGNRHNSYENYHKKVGNNDLRYSLPVVWSRMFKTKFVTDNNIIFDETIVSNDRMFALKSGVKAKNISVEEKSIYSWDYNSNSLTTKVSRERFLITLSVFIRADTYLRQHLSRVEYQRFSESGLKMIASTLFRYKFGIPFTWNVSKKLKNNGVTLIRFRDFKKIFNFIKNNKYYKSM